MQSFYADSMWLFSVNLALNNSAWKLADPKTWWTDESMIWTSTYLLYETKGKIYLTHTQHSSDAAPSDQLNSNILAHACFLSASILKAPDWQITIHLLIFFGSNQSVLLFSLSANTTRLQCFISNHASEAFGGHLWKKSPRHECALGALTNI